MFLQHSIGDPDDLSEPTRGDISYLGSWINPYKMDYLPDHDYMFLICVQILPVHHYLMNIWNKKIFF